MIGAKWYDMVVGIDIHWVMIPVPPAPPIPAPLPHPFTGLIFDPVGMALGAAINAGIAAATGGGFSGPVFINNMPSASTGTGATNKLVMPHFPMPPGIAWAPVPAGPKPPIPGKAPDPGIPSPIPSNDATMITGSKTVYIGGTNACRLGDLAMSCGEPVRLPSSTVIAIPMGGPVLIGGPPALDFMAMATSMIRSQWVSGKLHQVLKADPGSWKSKIICFLTGHPVDVMSGMVLVEAEDYELPGPIPFSFDRTYYSRSDYNGPLGFGWTHSYDMFLRKDPDRLVLHHSDGRDLYFYEAAPGKVVRNPVEQMDLGYGDQQIWVETAEKLRYLFADRKRANGTWPLVQICDRAGNHLDLDYDDRGFLVAIHDSCGRLLQFKNDQMGRLIEVFLPEPDSENRHFRALTYNYDDQGDLVSAGDALNHKHHYAYKYHLIVQETDRNGLSFYFAYDGIDHDAWCVRTWGDKGIYDHVLTYDKQKKVTVVENSLGHSTAYMGNPSGLVEMVVDALGGQTLYEWDQYYRKISETDANGNKTSWTYDERGNLLSETRPDGSVLSATYDGADNRLSQTSLDGQSWRWAYDPSSRIVMQENPAGEVATYSYQQAGMSTMVDPSGFRVTSTYDAMGNLIQMESEEGLCSRWHYDRLGRALKVEDGAGNIQTRRFNLLGNPLEIVAADGNRFQYEYDPEENPILIRDSYHEIRCRYEGMGTLVSRHEGGAEHQFLYDTEERLIGIRNQSGHEYRFQLNQLGEVTAEVGFDGVSREYERDKASRVTRVRHSGGGETSFQYDAMDRITAMNHKDGLVETFTYDRNGDLESAINGDVTVRYERDPMGRVTREYQNELWVANSFDHNHLIIHQNSSLGARIATQRNAFGDVMSLRAEDHGRLWEIKFQRDELGFETGRIQGPVRGRFDRDPLGRVTRHRVTAGAATRHLMSYQWGIADRLLESNNPSTGITRYLHDVTGSLSRSQNESETLWRNPDSFGNLYGGPQQDDRQYGAAGQLLQARMPDATWELCYDGDGNLKTRSRHSGETWKYSWDGAGRLRAIDLPDGQQVSYAYDPLGRRISRQFQGETTRWLWHDETILHQWTEGDQQKPAVVTWVYEPESFTPLARLDANQACQIVADYLGNPLMALDAEGQKLWAARLDINGRAQQLEGESEFCPFRFPGQYHDPESGLHYNRFRYYDPETGTYISQDPIGLAGGINLYAYVHDSLVLIDPLGLDWNYQLSGSNGKPYYSGRASDNQTPADVMRRHANTNGSDGIRFRRGVDKFRQITPPGTTRNISRGIEELGVLSRGEAALLGRKSTRVRGNKIHGVSLLSKNRAKYLAAARGFLTRKGMSDITELKGKICK